MAWLVCGTVDMAWDRDPDAPKDEPVFPLCRTVWRYDRREGALFADVPDLSFAGASPASGVSGASDADGSPEAPRAPHAPREIDASGAADVPGSAPSFTDTPRADLPPLPKLPVRRGTPTLLAACVATCEALSCGLPQALLVADRGNGAGSRALYARLARGIHMGARFDGITFHYLFPELDGHNRVLAAQDPDAWEDIPRDAPEGNAAGGAAGASGHSSSEDRNGGRRRGRPLLVADAGFMYAAKMSGYASCYDLFTPDVGELSFLADDKAPHPLYTRGFLLASEKDVPGLVERAYAHGNAARNLLVKGARDTVVLDGRVAGVVDAPDVPVLEAIGGTGDLVAGVVSGLLHAGLPMGEACLRAAKAARLAGAMANPTPATQIAEILPHLDRAVPAVLEMDLSEILSGKG